MTTFENLVIEADEIQKYLEIEFVDDVYFYTERGNKLSVFMARTGEMMAEAQFYLDDKKHTEIMKLITEVIESGKYSAKVQNALVDSVSKKERHLVNKITEINKSIKHQIEWCRTQISKIKAEMQYINH